MSGIYVHDAIRYIDDCECECDTVKVQVKEPVITTSDYNVLSNKPSINGVTLVGDKTSNDLGLIGIDSPEFTGTPTATTADEGDNSTRIATTEFVQTEISNAIDGHTSLPSGGVYGDFLQKLSSKDGDAEWVTPASEPEQDNTRPITAAGVYMTIGNINALLAGI